MCEENVELYFFGFQQRYVKIIDVVCDMKYNNVDNFSGTGKFFDAFLCFDEGIFFCLKNKRL